MSKDLTVKKHPGGRPTKYNKDFHPKFVKALALNGMSDINISKEMDISEKTLNNWKILYPEFLQCISEGKGSTNDQVKSALLRRALGYKETVERDVAVAGGGTVKVKEDKLIIPDVKACQVWLYNRDPANWKDRREVELSSDPDKPLQVVLIPETKTAEEWQK